MWNRMGFHEGFITYMSVNASKASMKVLSCPTWTGWRMILCTLGVIGACWSCPSKARASCAEYVVVGNPSDEYKQNIQHEREAIDHAKDRSCPCNGPQCRSSDSNPVPPATAPTVAEDALAGFIVVDWGKIVCFGILHLDESSIQFQGDCNSPHPPPPLFLKPHTFASGYLF